MDKNLKYYNDIFFKQREARRADYDAVSRWIGKNIEGKSFGDIGCGNGYMIAYLYKLGRKVWGVDAAENFEQYVDKEVRQYVKKADLTQAHKLDKSDVVLCFEVAERIDRKYADTLMKNIVSSKANTILFTAAKPGQAGVHHINLQPKKYWLGKFSKYGYCLDVALSERFKNGLAKNIKTIVWYLEDIMILQKCDNQKMTRAYTVAGNDIEELKLKVEELTIENTKLKYDVWIKGQRLNSILGSRRWKASSKLIRLIKR